LTGAKRHPLRSKLPALIGGGFLLLFTAGIVYWVVGFIGSAEKPQASRVQRISLVKPPPPKPPDEPPPEPEKLDQPKDEVPLEEPQPETPEASDEPPPGEDLAVEGEGGAGGDAFGLLGKKGVRELGGRGGDRDAWYGRLISRHLEQALQQSKKLRGASYRVVVNVWFGGSGIDRVQLVQGSGNAQTDDLLRQELLALPPLRETIPPDIPQPVRIRIASRG